jgi:hypothetical protein
MQSISCGVPQPKSFGKCSCALAARVFQLPNQADNAASGDSGLHCRFRAALRLIRTLGLRSFQSEVISFIAKSWRAGSSNIPGRVQLENRRGAKRFKSAAAKFLANTAFVRIKNHCQNLLQLVNEADNAARGSML